MRRIIEIIFTILFLYIPIPIYAQQITSVGVICWDKNTDIDLAGYRYFINTTGSVPSSTIDLGLLVTAPTPPTPAQACAPNQVGILRDQSTSLTGTYYFGVAAYDTIGNISPYTITSVTVYNNVNKIQKFFNHYFRLRSGWLYGFDKIPV